VDPGLATWPGVGQDEVVAKLERGARAVIARPGFGPYDVRSHVHDDIDAVADLIAAVERSVLGVVHVQRADIASLWSTDTFTPELDGVAVLEAGRMVAAAPLYGRSTRAPSRSSIADGSEI
jgi:hypothetical protein